MSDPKPTLKFTTTPMLLPRVKDRVSAFDELESVDTDIYSLLLKEERDKPVMRGYSQEFIWVYSDVLAKHRYMRLLEGGFISD